MPCVHYWIIEDDNNHHQIGRCKKCGETKDFGPNDTIVSHNSITVTDYICNPFKGSKGRVSKRTKTIPRELFQGDEFKLPNWSIEKWQEYFGFE